MKHAGSFALVLVLAALLDAPDAMAWGNDGHRIVGDIAWHFLKPRAEEAVRDYLTERGYSTLADAATWPDTYAKRFKKYNSMKSMHFVDIAPTSTGYQANRDCPRGCVVSALEKYIGVLGSHDDAVGRRARQQALYWVSHFMGDIHQPLHVAHPDMQGGNLTQVLFFGQPQKAHWVWDTGLLGRLEMQLRPAAEREEDAGAEGTWQYLAFSLWSDLTPDQVKSWQESASPRDWANETFGIAKAQAFLGPNDTVDQSYVLARTATIKQQLQRAGVRLAAVLNQTLGR
jgi:hypothetical protein